MSDWPPKKNAAFEVQFPIYDADGDLVTAASTPDSEVAKDHGTFTDCTNEATEIATSSGVYYLTLTSTEMNADIVATITKTGTAGAKTAVNVMYTVTRQLVDLAWPTTTGRSMDVDANGGVEVGSFQAGAIGAAAFAAGAIDAAAIATGAIDADAIADNAIDAGAIAADAITAAKIAAGAIDADAIAADAIGSSEFAQAAADKVWSSVTRNLTALGFALGAADIGTGAIDADALAADAVTELRSLASGASDSGSTTTMVDAARTEADADYWKGCLILFTSGTIAGQVRLITGFTPASDTITFTPATTQAVSTQTYEILPAGGVDLRLWLGSAPNALQSGRVDSYVGAMAAAVIAAASFAAGAIDAAAIGTGAIDADAIAAAALTAAKFAAGAIDAGAIAPDAIGSSEFAQAAADKVWSSVTRNLTALGFVLAAADIGADAIGASELAADAANEIADAILKRDIDQVEATAAVHSLTTAILKAVSRIRDNAGTLQVFRTDAITVHMSQTVTTDATLDPVDELAAGV